LHKSIINCANELSAGEDQPWYATHDVAAKALLHCLKFPLLSLAGHAGRAADCPFLGDKADINKRRDS
jgi:hypothetical protein